MMKTPLKSKAVDKLKDYRSLDSNYFDHGKFNIWNYLKVEMFGIGEPGVLEPPSNENISNFFSVPLVFEKLVFLGCAVCFDSFLYVVTYLPIRVAFSLCLLLNECWSCAFSASLWATARAFVFVDAHPPRRRGRRAFSFHRTHIFDLMRGGLLALGCAALLQINMSRVYHYIRGQSMIKLYVLTSMMEVMDKLFSAFGQDVFDALHSQTKHDPWSLRLLLRFAVVSGYVALHAGLHFLHVATLTVVINSADETLLTVLILNNFSEMKSFVFKKFDGNNLFQLACADITERFQMALFLAVILLVALAQAGAAWPEVLPGFFRVAAYMLASEAAVDGMKHAFIGKFNSISAAVYLDFACVLRGDVLSNQKDAIILDHTYSVTRRMGLSQIPLGCVCIRYVSLALSAPAVQQYVARLTTSSLWLHALLVFSGLVALKVAVGVGLVLYATSVREQDAELFLKSPAPATAATVGGVRDAGMHDRPTETHVVTSSVGTTDVLEGTTTAAAPPEEQLQQERLEFMEELAGMERYTIYKGRVMG